ncbi:MAG: hypothetical protein ACI4DT_04105 [Chordicoccus sp.]
MAKYDYTKVDWNAFKEIVGDDVYDMFASNDQDDDLSDGYTPIDPNGPSTDDLDGFLDDFYRTHEEHLSGSQEYVILPK